MRIELIGCEFTTTTEPTTVSTASAIKTTSSQPTSAVRTTQSTLASFSTNGLSGSTIHAPPKSSQASATTTEQNRIQGAIIGGAVAGGVIILVIPIIVVIFVRRRRSRNTEEKRSAAQPEEMDRNNIRGPHVSEDGEYVDTLPFNVNSQQTSGKDNVGYENIPMDGPVRTLQQIGTLRGDVYVNVPPAPPSGQYEELRPAVYQSLQKVHENTPPSGGVYDNVPPPPPSGQYEELRPAVYQSLQKC